MQGPKHLNLVNPSTQQYQNQGV